MYNIRKYETTVRACSRYLTFRPKCCRFLTFISTEDLTSVLGMDRVVDAASENSWSILLRRDHTASATKRFEATFIKVTYEFKKTNFNLRVTSHPILGLQIFHTNWDRLQIFQQLSLSIQRIYFRVVIQQYVLYISKILVSLPRERINSSRRWNVFK